MNHAVAEQAPPSGAGEVVYPEVMKDLDSFGFPELKEDFMSRVEKGVQTYGEPLTAFNGRSSLVDAYQEALDMMAYLKQGILEGFGLHRFYLEAIKTAAGLRQTIKGGE